MWACRAALVVLLALSLLGACALRARDMSMKWTFSKGVGTLKELGLVGSEGEFYFHPTKRANLRAPSTVLGKSVAIPIYFLQNVICPRSSDLLNAFEMKHRQLIQDVGEHGVFGLAHISHANQKVSLLGTLVQIKEKRHLSDGRALVLVEAKERFFVKEYLQELPYHKASVQLFGDYCEDYGMLTDLEGEVLRNARISLQLMNALHPAKNYSFSNSFLKFCPKLWPMKPRMVALHGLGESTRRSTDFSYAVMEMLQLSPTAKLAMMQEIVVENRMKQLLRAMASGTDFLRQELLQKGLMTTRDISEVENRIHRSQAHFIDPVLPPPYTLLHGLLPGRPEDMRKEQR